MILIKNLAVIFVKNLLAIINFQNLTLGDIYHLAMIVIGFGLLILAFIILLRKKRKK